MTETVIVAHGLYMPGTETRLLRYRLERAGFRTMLFRFRSLRGTLAQNVGRLARFAEQASGDRLHFVGHSLGGVIILHMLMRHRLKRVGRIVCLGSPLVSCRTASFFMRAEFARALVGRSLAEHADRGGLRSWESGFELGIIAGTRNIGIGRLMRSLPEPNDGTVAVEETRLPGATAHLSLPVTHTQLMFDRAVARQTAHFLRFGAFMR